MVVEQQESAAAPAAAFERLRPGADVPRMGVCPYRAELPETRRAARLPKERPPDRGQGHPFAGCG